MVRIRFAICVICLMLLSSALAESSWSQINQTVEKQENWKQIVTDTSDFELGEAVPYEPGSELKIGKWGTYPSIDGSTVCVPMAMEFARQWLGLGEEDLEGFVNFSTTPNAYDRLTEGKGNPQVTIVSRNLMMEDTHPIDLVLGTAPNADERNAAKAAGMNLVMVPVCYDAFIFMVNGDNPVNSLTAEQIRGIYTGTYDEVNGVEPVIDDWAEVGGISGEIQAFQRPHGSGSQTAMEELVMKDTPLITAEENMISGGMSDAVQRIGGYNNGSDAIGYSYLYYVSSLYVEENIKVLAIDGIEPSAKNLRSGAYPYTVCYYAVYEDGNETAARFADWMTSDEGQACIAQAGYISLR